jgi:hypothetical protein
MGNAEALVSLNSCEDFGRQTASKLAAEFANLQKKTETARHVPKIRKKK